MIPGLNDVTPNDVHPKRTDTMNLTATTTKKTKKTTPAADRKLASRDSGLVMDDLISPLLDHLLARGCGIEEATAVLLGAARTAAGWFDQHPAVGKTGKAVFDASRKMMLKEAPFPRA